MPFALKKIKILPLFLKAGLLWAGLSGPVFSILKIMLPNTCACCRCMLNSLGCTAKSMMIEELVLLYYNPNVILPIMALPPTITQLLDMEENVIRKKDKSSLRIGQSYELLQLLNSLTYYFFYTI